MDKFKQLGISEGILNVIKQVGFTEPSEIQEKTIPLVLAGKDVIGKSATGSGKTLAFGAGIIDKVKRGEGIQALVLTPTRELAEQVAQSLAKFSKHKGLNIKEIYGGVGIGPQIRALKYADIVVGTPGRILDHLRGRTLFLGKVKFLVLDEADRMLDMGFIRDVESIIKACPLDRQTLLFSATISGEISRIANKYMKTPIGISVQDQVDPSQLYQKYYDVQNEEKFSLLAHLLKLEKQGVVMVFCNTRRNVEKLTHNLNQQGLHALAIHGGLSQNRRSDTLRAFHSRETLILICTDVAARGLDIKGVSHVYNFDIPATSDDYIHRIGRTARAGKNGIAISFVAEGDHTEFRQICKEKGVKIEKEKVPDMKIIPIAFSSNADRKKARQGGRGRGRSGGGDWRRGGRSGGERRGGREFGGRRENRDDRRGGQRGFRPRFQRRR
ncbi:MAG: DEAD/DEAH box helicase [Nanoarchaeota archaeon]|nr:DEAD/DEAH box helicase [Nanoarchaeota archaeon]